MKKCLEILVVLFFLLSASNNAHALSAAVSWTDIHGNFWLFGGQGYDSTGNLAYLNDLWKFDGTNWTWVSGSSTGGQAGSYGTQGAAAPGNVPGARSASVSWTDAQGDFWLLGGQGYDSGGNQGDLNDLWKFAGATWAWVSGSSTVDQGGKGVGAAPAIVQHVDTNMAGSALVTGKTIALPNPTISGNCLVVAIFWQWTSSNAIQVGIKDDAPGGSNTYALAKNVQDQTKDQQVSIYVAQHIKAGTRNITVSFSGGGSKYTVIKVTEIAGISATAAVDKTSGAVVSGSSIAAGSFTPAQSGDFIYQVAFEDSLHTPAFSGQGPANVSFTAGTSPSQWSFMPGGVNSADGHAVQYLVYDSDNSIDPTFNDSGTNANYITAAVALKPDTTQGGVPGAGIRVVAAQHVILSGNIAQTSAQVKQFVTTGNLQICLSPSGDGISGISSTRGSWTNRASEKMPSFPEYANVFDSVNQSAGTQDLTVTFNSPGNAPSAYGFPHDIILLDVAGAATAPFDKSAVTTGDQTSGPYLSVPSLITPSTTNGLVVAVIAQQNNVMTTIYSPVADQYNINTLDANEPPFTLDDCAAGWGIMYNTTTGAVSWDWNVTGPVGNWAAATAAYKHQ